MLRKLFAPDGAPSGGTATADSPSNTQATPPAASDTPPAGTEPSFKELYDGLAALDEPETSPAGDKPPKEEDETPLKEGEDGKPPKADDKAGNGKPPKAEDVKPETTPKPRAKELKAVYEETKAKLAKVEPELAEARKKIEQLEKAGPMSEIKTLTAQLEASEKRRKELEQEIEFTSYQKSEKFDKEFQQPYIKAYAEALEEIAEFPVTDQNRNGNVDDLREICMLPGGDALKRATELFGEHVAGVIMTHRREIRRLAKAQQTALDDAKKNSETRMETEKAERAKVNARYADVWKNANAKLAKDFPSWAGAVEGDEDGNKLLAEGYRKVDDYFTGEKMSPEERIAAQTEIRMKAANHDRMALRLKRVRTKLKEVETELAQFKGSRPPRGGDGTGRTPVHTKGFAEDLAEEARKWESQGVQ